MFSGIPNLLTQIFSCFLLTQGRIFVLRSKMLLKLLIFTKKKTLCKIFRRKQNSSLGEKLLICRLRIHENMPRASYKCGLLPRLYYETLVIFLQLPREPLRITFHIRFRDAAGFSNPGGLAVMWWA